MSLHKMLRAAAGYQAPAPANTDPQFNYVSMLLHGDGTNGSQNNTFVDSSTNNFTITRSGNTTQGSLSPYGNLWSNFFDGTTYLSIPSNTAFSFGTGDLTVEAWIYDTGTTAAYAQIVGASTYGLGNDFLLSLNGTTRALYGQLGSTGGASSSGTVPANIWTHVAMVRSGTTVSFYINGSAAGSYTDNDSVTSSIAVTIGTSSNNNSDARFKGYISNLRVVKGTAVYTSAFTPPTAPLTAISGTSLLTCQSNRFIDNSANNFTITRNGDVRVTKEAPFLPTAAYSTSVIGGSGYFDGTGDYLTAPSSTAFNFGTGDFTVEAWINPSTVSGTKAIMGIFQGGVGGWYFGMNGASLRFSSGLADYDAGTLVANVWSHVAATVSGGNLRMFINGVQVNTTTNVSAQNFNFTNSLWVGNINTAGWTFTGYISDPRVVKGTAVYTSNFTPPTAPLTAITNTSLLLNFTNAGIFDNAAENVLETVGNAQISTSVKKYGTGSLAFDGTGDWLLVPDEANLRMGTGNFTVEAWVYLSATGSARGLVGKGTSTTGWLLSTNSSDQVVFTYGSTTLTSSSALSANTWTHVAVVREGTGTNQTKIYIGGSLVATGTVATDFNQTNPMYIGADRTGGSALNGYIDDLRITKGFARYTAAFTPPTAAFPDQ